jgi:hypothetical protein
MSGSAVLGESLVRRSRVHLGSVGFVLVLFAAVVASHATVCFGQGVGPGLAPAVDERPLIQFAGGTLEFRLPDGWQATELPVGREVRLVLAPVNRSSSSRPAAGRIWLACHAAGVLGEQTNNMAQVMSSRVAKATRGRGQIVRTRKIEVARHRGWQTEFVLPRQDDPNTPHIVGWHILLSTDGGLREVHLAALAEHSAHVRVAGDAVLRSLALRPQRAIETPIASSARDATQILGAWKALRSRFYLDAAGNIAIQLDRPTTLSLGPEVRGVSNPPRVIRGRFVAQGNLLRVTWNDGSRLNYRWSLSQGDLLLTDHDGNTSQLRRLVQ